MFRSLRQKLNGKVHREGKHDDDDPHHNENEKDNNENDTNNNINNEPLPPIPSTRSVNHFSSPDELKQALLSGTEGSCGNVEPAWLFSQDYSHAFGLEHIQNNNNKSQMVEPTDESAPVSRGPMDPKMDWVLENYDAVSTEEQSLSHELRRLLVLRSYLVLDTERQESFDQVTKLASERFQCPIALISLVDVGRQWFLSNRGLPEDVREAPRKLAICAHCIQSKHHCLVVPDATKDERFQNNPLVTGPPHVTFYAGAPLLSPEGYKLGTLCVIDHQARPNGLTALEEQELQKFAAMAVDAMVQHRQCMSVWFNNLVSTHYPTFTTLELPDVDPTEASDSSGDEDSVEEDIQKEEGRRNDKDKDPVSNFLATTEHMPLHDLVAMLRQQARDQDHAADFLQPFEQLVEARSSATSKTTKTATICRKLDQPKPKKHVHFADSTEDQKLCLQIHLIESYKSMKTELWWCPRDMQKFRSEASELVQHYRRYKRGFGKLVTDLVTLEESEDALEPCMRRLIKHPMVRGLEMHIVTLLLQKSRATIRAVLQEQDECRLARKDYETTSRRLRQQAVACSGDLKTYAARNARCDELAALSW